MKDKMIRLIALTGVALCFMAVVIGAFGAHAFGELLEANQRYDVFNLANRYQFYHGLAMVAVAALFKDGQAEAKLTLPAVLMFIGTLIFSGSLYLLALLNVSWLGAITPIGGTILVVSWYLLLMKVLKFIS